MKWALAIIGLSTACANTTQKKDACPGGQVCIIAGTGELGFNGDELPALDTRLASPTAVYESPDQEIVIADFSNMRIRFIDANGVIRTRVGNGFHAYSEMGASSLDTPLENPIDMAWNTDDDLCVLPLHEGRVVCLNDDDEIERFAGTGGIEDTGDGGPAIEAQMGFVSGMAFANDGTLFVSDSTHSKVRRVHPDGTIDTVLGTGKAGLNEATFGPEVMLRFPERVAIDPIRERLIVADTYNHRVLSMDINTLQTSVLAGNGEAGWEGDGGPAHDAQLNTPVGVTVGPDSGVYISDNRNHVVRHIDDGGEIHTVVGTGDYSLTEDPSDRLDFNVVGPSGISWTAAGDLLIAEQFGHRILRVTDLANQL